MEVPHEGAALPRYALGDQWVRSDGIYDLLHEGSDSYLFSAGRGTAILLTRTLSLARIMIAGQIHFDFSPPAELVWPLRVGAKGSGRGTLRLHHTSYPAMMTWRVEAYEPIDVPAGRLTAFRIAHEFTPLGGGEFGPRSPRPPNPSEQLREIFRKAGGHPAGEGPVRFTLWYAPEARQLVKLDAQTLPLDFTLVRMQQASAEPIRIEITEPSDQSRIESGPVIELSGRASGGAGVTRVVVSLNGDEVARQETPRAPKPVVFLKVPLPLRSGRNVVLVTAEDATGVTVQEARVLTYGPPRLALPPETPMPRPLRVEVSAPSDQARVEQEMVPLTGEIYGGTGVRRVVVTVNGIEVARREAPPADRPFPLDLSLTLREGPNTVVVTALEPDGTLHQAVRTVHYTRPMPLAVDVRYPADQLTVAHESSIVAAVASSSRGIGRITVSVNGVTVHEERDPLAKAAVTITVPVTLREGANTISVTAAEPQGAVVHAVRQVTYVKPPGLAAEAPTPVAAAPPSDRWAVIVGVGEYQHPAIPKLRFARHDAEAVYRMLTGPGGFKKENVLLFTDRTERPPTYRNLKWALGTFLARAARKHDTVVVYFAGHGAPEIDQSGIERDGFTKYLVPSDADPDDLYSTALPMDELNTVFSRVEAERIVVFLDTCYSGAAGGRTFASRKTRALGVDDLFLQRLTRSKGRVIVTASRPSEVSLELAELGHGLFTFYLVQGLEGHADGNRDGIVSLQELYEYVEREVSTRSRQVGGNQHPVMKGDLEGPLPLVRLPSR